MTEQTPKTCTAPNVKWQNLLGWNETSALKKRESGEWVIMPNTQKSISQAKYDTQQRSGPVKCIYVWNSSHVSVCCRVTLLREGTATHRSDDAGNNKIHLFTCWSLWFQPNRTIITSHLKMWWLDTNCHWVEPKTTVHSIELRMSSKKPVKFLLGNTRSSPRLRVTSGQHGCSQHWQYTKRHFFILYES